MIACMPCFPSFFIKFRYLISKACNSLRLHQFSIPWLGHRLTIQPNKRPDSSTDLEQLGKTSISSNNRTVRKGNTKKNVTFLHNPSGTQLDNHNVDTTFDLERQQHSPTQEQQSVSWRERHSTRGPPEILKTTDYKVECMVATR